jgi:hypothetical protein
MTNIRAVVSGKIVDDGCSEQELKSYRVILGSQGQTPLQLTMCNSRRDRRASEP